jgi:Ca2+-binding EF-hand superfamily protein
MPATVTAADEAMYRETFNIVDRDCDGAVSLDEFRTFMRSLGCADDDEKLKEKMASVGATASLSQPQFVKFLSSMKEGTCNEAEIADALSVFDKSADGMGYISSRELGSALSKMGSNPLSSREVQELLLRAKKNQDGQINYKEWIKFIMRDPE